MQKCHRLAVVGVAGLTLSVHGQIPSFAPRTDLWGTDAPVNGAAMLGSTLYFTGSFSQVGPVTESFAVVNDAGQPLIAFPQIEGRVTAMAPDGNGGVFVVGNFAYAGGQPRTNGAHFRADGSLDGWNPAIPQDMQSLLKVGSTVYIGGPGLLAVDATLGFPLGPNFAVQGNVNALALSGGRLYVAGSFTSLLGAPRQSLAAIDTATNALLPWTAAVSGNVSALLVSNGVVYVGGSYNLIGGQPRANIAAITEASATVTALNPATDGSVFSMLLSGTTLYLGGHFSHCGGQPRAAAAAIDVGTNAVLPWAPVTSNGANAPVVHALALGPNGIAVGGEFQSVNGVERPCLAEVDQTLGTLTAWNPHPAAGAGATPSVYALTPLAAGLAIGGQFVVVGGVLRAGGAAIDLASGQLLPWVPMVTPPPDQRLFGFALAADADHVFISGQFSTAQGSTPIPVLQAFDPVVGAIDPNFVAFSQATVHQPQMALQAGVLYLNCSNGCLCALNAATGDLLWCSPLSEIVRVVAPSQELQAVFLSRDHSLTAVAMSDGTPLPWQIPANDQILALQLNGSRLYVGGRFQQLGTATRPGLAAIDFPTLMNPVIAAWNPSQIGTSVSLSSLALRAPSLYLSGSISSIGGVPRTNLASINLDNTAACAWAPDSQAGAALSLGDSSLVMFGGALRFSHRVFEGVAVFPLHACEADVTADCLLNVNDFIAFQSLFASGSTAANCDQSTIPPVLNVNDFACFTNAFAAGCR